MTTLAMTGALVSTLAAASGGFMAGPRVTDLEVFKDGLTFVAAGSFAGRDPGEPAQVVVRARGLVTGACHDRERGAVKRFAVPMMLKGGGPTRRVGRESTFFVRTAPPELASAEVCPGGDWSVATSEIQFTAVKLQAGPPGARVVCQFPAVDGPVIDPGCQIER